MLARLTQELNVDLNQFRKSGNAVIPFVCQPVSPAALHWPGVEFLSHHLFDTAFICGGVQIEIRTQIRPMIQRFDYRYLAPARFQGIAD